VITTTTASGTMLEDRPLEGLLLVADEREGSQHQHGGDTPTPTADSVKATSGASIVTNRPAESRL
jgi:hypothetical protein